MATKKMVYKGGEWVEVKGDTFQQVKPVTSSSSSWHGSGSGYSSSSVYTGWSGSSGTGWQSCKKHTWEPVYKFSSIDIYGAAKADIPAIDKKEKNPPNRLIVNCTGYSINSSSKPFVEKTPDALKDLKDPKYQIKLKTSDELLLEWSDGGAPLVYPKFWTDLGKLSEAAGYTEIVFCCMGGHGRTGTALAAFGLANGVFADPDAAISAIRKQHCKKAVESWQQIEYLEWTARTLLKWVGNEKGQCKSDPSK